MFEQVLKYTVAGVLAPLPVCFAQYTVDGMLSLMYTVLSKYCSSNSVLGLQARTILQTVSDDKAMNLLPQDKLYAPNC